MSAKDEYERLKPAERLGDAPVQDEYHELMTRTMRAIDEMFNGVARPRKTGVVVMVFPFGDIAGRVNYMSNGASREDIVVLMKEMIARFTGQPELKGRA